MSINKAHGTVYAESGKGSVCITLPEDMNSASILFRSGETTVGYNEVCHNGKRNGSTTVTMPFDPKTYSSEELAAAAANSSFVMIEDGYISFRSCDSDYRPRHSSKEYVKYVGAELDEIEAKNATAAGSREFMDKVNKSFSRDDSFHYNGAVDFLADFFGDACERIF